MRPQSNPPNPFGLSKRESEVLDALISGGCRKRAADLLRLSLKTVEGYSSTAQRKIKPKVGANDRTPYLIVWDRWRRDNPPQEKQP